MRFVCCFALFVLAGSARAEDVENPEFVSWSKHKKGTVVTLKKIDSASGSGTQWVVTYTLHEVASDHVTIVLQIAIELPEGDMKPIAHQYTVPKSKKLAKEERAADVRAGKPDGAFDEGKETLDQNGIKLKTRWFKYKTAARGRSWEGQVWLSEDVPNLVVRRHETFIGDDAPVVTVLNLVEIKTP